MAGNDVPMSLSPADGWPSWLRARPFLFAGTLRWLNIQRRYPFLLPVAVVLLIADAGLLMLPMAGHLLEAAAQYPFTPFATLGAVCAIATAHRKAHLRQGLVDSWLAPLAAPSSVLLRLLLPPLLQVLLLALNIAIPLSTGALRWEAAVTLWLTVGAAYVVGSLIGWFSYGGTVASVPAFHYVAVRRPRERWAQAPQLEPLSYWAVGQARVFAKPKIAANALLLVLLAIPLGTSGQVAVAIAGGAWVLLYVVSLFVATIRVAFQAVRWLAPTTIRYLQFTGVLGYRVLLTQLWVWGWVVFLSYAAALRGALRIGLPLALLFLFMSCAVTLAASWVAMRSVGMRSS